VSLEYLGHWFINFADRSYRWIDLKRFRCGQHCEAADALAALLENRHYRDLYMSPDSHERDAETLHGPYRVAEITPACFDSITAIAAAEMVEEFCRLDGYLPPAQVRVAVDAQVLSLIGGKEYFRLRHLPDAVHEFGAVLVEFRELVIVDRDQCEVFLVVMAID
jgi:hypothetical protein